VTTGHSLRLQQATNGKRVNPAHLTTRPGIIVEIDIGLSSSSIRPPERPWLVRLQRLVIIATGSAASRPTTW